MSSDESEYDEGEIKLTHTVMNTNYTDSEVSDESDISDLEEPERRDRLKSIDEETEENAMILQELLTDVAEVEPVGKKVIKVQLFDKKKKFLKRKDDVDFDVNEHGYPIVPPECEEYLLPFLEKLKELREEFKGTKIETNAKNISYKF